MARTKREGRDFGGCGRCRCANEWVRISCTCEDIVGAKRDAINSIIVNLPVLGVILVVYAGFEDGCRKLTN